MSEASPIVEKLPTANLDGCTPSDLNSESRIPLLRHLSPKKGMPTHLRSDQALLNLDRHLTYWSMHRVCDLARGQDGHCGPLHREGGPLGVHQRQRARSTGAMPVHPALAQPPGTEKRTLSLGCYTRILLSTSVSLQSSWIFGIVHCTFRTL
jgi:hypothetical protein